jgi:hypothetical protein
MQNNQIIILLLVVALIIGGIIGWFLGQRSAIPPQEEVVEEEGILEEVFSLSGIVSGVDVENNLLMVKPDGEEKTIQVTISEGAELIDLEPPFDQKSAPPNVTFTHEQTEIEISDFQVGDNVFIKSMKNIAGRTKIDNIDYIHILP